MNTTLNKTAAQAVQIRIVMSELMGILVAFYTLIAILFIIGFYISTYVKSEEVFKEFKTYEALLMPVLCGLIWPIVVYFKIKYS